MIIKGNTNSMGVLDKLAFKYLETNLPNDYDYILYKINVETSGIRRYTIEYGCSNGIGTRFLTKYLDDELRTQYTKEVRENKLKRILK